MRSIAACLFLALVACATKPSIAPEQQTITADVPTIVQRTCQDQRKPAETYPDTDAALAMIADADFERLARAYRAGRDRRDARLLVDDVQIKGCAAAH